MVDVVVGVDVVVVEALEEEGVSAEVEEQR